jgi:hypothetical protein
MNIETQHKIALIIVKLWNHARSFDVGVKSSNNEISTIEAYDALIKLWPQPLTEKDIKESITWDFEKIVINCKETAHKLNNKRQ